MSAVTVREEGTRSHFAMIPHLVDDLGLTQKAYRLYGHLKRLAGEKGRCEEGVDAMARKCGMSKGSLIAAKRELEKHELIEIVRSKDRTTPDEIVILDVWARNAEAFSKEERGPKEGTRVVQSGERVAVQNRERKKNHREEPKEEPEEERERDAPLPDDTTSRCLLRLKKVKGIGKNYGELALLLGELRVEFPRIDPEAVCKEYELYHRAPPKPTKNHALKLRRFFTSASERQDERRRGHLRAVGGRSIATHATADDYDPSRY